MSITSVKVPIPTSQDYINSIKKKGTTKTNAPFQKRTITRDNQVFYMQPNLFIEDTKNFLDSI